MSLSFLISGAQVVPDALLQGDLRFKLLASFDTARALVQALHDGRAGVARVRLLEPRAGSAWLAPW